MIDSSTINLSLLPWLPLEERAAFPKRPAIYFAIDSLGVVQYIGRSQDVRARWGSHHKYEVLSAISFAGSLMCIANVKVAYLFIDTPELLPNIERDLVKFFNPPYNAVLRNQTVWELRAKAHFRDWIKEASGANIFGRKFCGHR